jgi:hypothetical protein
MTSSSHRDQLQPKATRPWHHRLSSFPSFITPSFYHSSLYSQTFRHGRSTTARQSGRPHHRALFTSKRQTYRKEDLGLWCHRCTPHTGWNITLELRIELLCHFLVFDLGLATLVFETGCRCYLARKIPPRYPSKSNFTNEDPKNREDPST